MIYYVQRSRGTGPDQDPEIYVELVRGGQLLGYIESLRTSILDEMKKSATPEKIRAARHHVLSDTFTGTAEELFFAIQVTVLGVRLEGNPEALLENCGDKQTFSVKPDHYDYRGLGWTVSVTACEDDTLNAAIDKAYGQLLDRGWTSAILNLAGEE